MRPLALCVLALACGRLNYELLDDGAAHASGGGGSSSSGGATGGKGGAVGSAATGAGGQGATQNDGGGGAGVPDTAGAPSGGQPGVAGAGGCTGIEICDGLDNDCAGGVDDGACSPGCEGYTYAGHAYAFCNTARVHADAAADCPTMGMQLVAIQEQLENEWLRTIVLIYSGTNNNTSAWRWIGANDLDGDDVWLWPDGTALSWENWSNGNPGSTDACARMQNGSSNPLWTSMPSDQLAPYVCELY